ncbi:baseplate J/gp47 family protein [Roseomonas eburnea]|uniref:Baseplate J/gp47 family protein n=1 Tax=Neoroseomonas eburnea TaxID=1346889 RepID=A0A9X9XDW7_9PROT|nr:baseplate J/gp47 family protein [Neoroseomonas eburnea]MBR0681903.1 baseplate J/gp47 family protein [Neoroseomonas eburnea]
MTWPLPTPDAIAERLAGGMETALETADRRVDARSPNTVLGVLARVVAMGQFDLWLYQRRIADDLMPDTAAAEALERHADIWGVTRLPASPAIGSATFTGSDGTLLPAGLELRAASGQIYTTDSVAEISGGTATVAVLATEAGAAGNQVAGAVLQLVAPIAGVLPQSAVVAAGGLTGGADLEADEALRSRLLARIRQRPHGGAAYDYEEWARAASPDVAHVAVYGNWAGLGTVAVVIGMRGPRAPETEELAAVAAHIAPLRPVTADVQVLAAVPVEVDITLTLSPDTVQTRAAVEAALATYFAADARIGQRLARSRISEAISSAAGEYSHSLTLPAADVEPEATELPILGTITFEAP